MKFKYTAFDSKGVSSTGDVEATDQEQASDILRRRGLFASELSTDTGVASSDGSHNPFAAGKRLRNLAMFSRQMHVLVSSGTPLVQALTAVERQAEDRHWHAVIRSIRETVEQGTPLSEAMRKFPREFDAVCLSLIAAGETSGEMPAMLDRLAVLSRKQLKLRGMVVGALIYPCLLIVLGINVLLTMLLFVLPRFADLFVQLDAPLPPTTQALMWISVSLSSYWWLILPGVMGCFVGAYWWFAKGTGKRTLDITLLRLPKVGKIVRSLMTARIARMLGVLLESRVTLLDALKLSRESLTHEDYSTLITCAEEAVKSGEPVSSVLGVSDLISAPVQEALRTGEASGRYGAPLVQMADFLDEENDVIVKALTGLIEPAILIVLGVVVGFVALSLFLPLFDLVSAAQKGGH